MDNISRKIEIGKNLIEVKQVIGHGNWLYWLEMEGKMSQRSAQRLIRIAEKFPNAPGLAHLNIGVESLDILSQNNTPEEVRQEVFELAESGETPTAKEVKELKAKNKELNDLIQQQSEVGYSFWLNRPEIENLEAVFRFDPLSSNWRSEKKGPGDGLGVESPTDTGWGGPQICMKV